MISLLDEPLFGLGLENERIEASLPELYAHCATGRVQQLTGLRAHQEHPVHATLCQLGAIALVNAGLAESPESAAAWRDALTALTAAQHPAGEPWQLVVDDVTRPAFLQPPVSSAARAAEYRHKDLHSPDAMDITVGSRRHDVKDGVMRCARPEHWIYALITVQCAGGHEGRGLYAMSRMNKGFSSRHGLGITHDASWGAHLTRDINRLTDMHRGADTNGLLIWTIPWDGTKAEMIPIESIGVPALYVEAGKRLRLQLTEDGSIEAVRATSEKNRIDPGETNGRTGDPWTVTTPTKGVSMGPDAFNYSQIARYLDQEKFEMPTLARPDHGDPEELRLIGRAMTRGQGETNGYHQVDIPLRRMASGMLGTAGGREAVAGEARDRVNIVRETSRILGTAIRIYLDVPEGTKDPGTMKKGIIDEAAERLERDVEEDFWTRLQDGLEDSDPAEARRQWARGAVIPRARRVLNAVLASGQGNGANDYRARARATDAFENGAARSRRLP